VLQAYPKRARLDPSPRRIELAPLLLRGRELAAIYPRCRKARSAKACLQA